MSTQPSRNTNNLSENFKAREGLPNVDIPDRNYPPEYRGQKFEVDKTAQLSVDNMFDAPSVYTDKFFDPTKVYTNNGSLDTSKDTSNGDNTNSSYYSLAGQSVDSSYFRHNNMVPFFGAKNHKSNVPNSTESTLDNYIGAGSQTITKKEISPMFAPGENLQWAFGTPNNTDFIKSRINPSSNMANIKPFEEIRVGPGIGQGYGTEGVGGFNSGVLGRELWMEKTVDQMRTVNNPKPGGIGLLGHEGPSTSYIKNMGDTSHMGIMEKNRVDRDFNMTPERYFTTTGAKKGETLRAIDIERHVSRPETSQSYSGPAGSKNNDQYVSGEYMPTKMQNLGALPFTPAGADRKGSVTDTDYGLKSGTAYPNNRSSNTQDSYFGILGGNLSATIAPLLDILRPSRRENTIGTLRPYQNAKGRVESSYVYNSADRPAATIRETTENSKMHHQVNSRQNGGAYRTTPHQPTHNERDTTTDFFYAGNASAGDGTREARPYDAEYRQRNNDLKSSTNVGYTPAGGMSLLNGQMNMSSSGQRENEMKNTRSVVPALPVYTPSVNSMGQVQGSAGIYSGIQMDRANPEMLSQLKGNPYALSVLGGI
jgi:hypothetical protein